MAINGRVYTSLEFVYSYPWHQPGSTHSLDRQKTGGNARHYCLTCRYALAECSDHLFVSSHLSANRTYSGGTSSITRRGTCDRRNYVPRWTELCPTTHSARLERRISLSAGEQCTRFCLRNCRHIIQAHGHRRRAWCNSPWCPLLFGKVGTSSSSRRAEEE